MKTSFVVNGEHGWFCGVVTHGLGLKRGDTKAPRETLRGRHSEGKDGTTTAGGEEVLSRGSTRRRRAAAPQRCRYATAFILFPFASIGGRTEQLPVGGALVRVDASLRYYGGHSSAPHGELDRHLSLA